MPPVPGRPPLPDDLYPVNYADLSTLTGLAIILVIHSALKATYGNFAFVEERADILMSCFDIEFERDNKDTNIRTKIIEIAGFMGVWMEDEFLEEYEDWHRQEWEKVPATIRSRARSDSETLE